MRSHGQGGVVKTKMTTMIKSKYWYNILAPAFLGQLDPNGQ